VQMPLDKERLRRLKLPIKVGVETVLCAFTAHVCPPFILTLRRGKSCAHAQSRPSSVSFSFALARTSNESTALGEQPSERAISW